jgi:hypothetical protein
MHKYDGWRYELVRVIVTIALHRSLNRWFISDYRVAKLGPHR